MKRLATMIRLSAALLLAPAVGHARQDLEKVIAAGDEAIAGLVAVDGKEHRRIDAIARFDRPKTLVEVGIIALSPADQ